MKYVYSTVSGQWTHVPVCACISGSSLNSIYLTHFIHFFKFTYLFIAVTDINDIQHFQEQ